jgi:hypothetical protein
MCSHVLHVLTTYSHIFVFRFKLARFRHIVEVRIFSVGHYYDIRKVPLIVLIENKGVLFNFDHSILLSLTLLLTIH